MLARPVERHGGQRLAFALADSEVETTPPGFYCQMAMNSLTNEELRVFAIFLGVRLGAPDVVQVAIRFRIFDTIERDWWGRAYMPDFPSTP